MTRWILAALLILAARAVPAQDVLAARTLRAGTVIAPADLRAGDAAAVDALAGMELRVAVYAGRPVGPGDVGPPAVMRRNDPVRLVHAGGGIRIATEGRALGRAAAGERVRVMNLASHATVEGVARPDGTVLVLP
ncbi:flagella basal body P-ring formation protein FlgA [Hasllibacter halocynthiae]|uniref:Flagella basal body P-ring formation protein FlgA n=1 Tax=Hasllibacter halocynthiae TaxID=595589 RepID=A0A2T0X2N9_9RHOB|nr:flagellar basal body P-ring formation chaperone FlgA [Hasllibacter halocynthiae]PRY93210.1 flagella basal body P-ring formation protein FlgA [Hasllibacter halocynthiae]